MTPINVSYKITIVPNIEALNQAMAKVPQETNIILERTLDTVANFAEQWMRGKAPAGPTGELVTSISTDRSYLTRAIGPTVPYGSYVERPRGAGGVPPLGGAHGLMAWAQFKGMTAGEGVAIAKAIAKRGVKAKGGFVDATQTKVEDNFWQLTQEAVDLIARFIAS